MTVTRYEPEVGQMVSGTQEWGTYDVPDYVDALVSELLREMNRVYWNVKQKEWEHHDAYDLDLPGMTYHPYYWGDCTCGFEALDEQWDQQHSHAPECFHSRYQEMQGILEPADDWHSAHEQLTAWAKENGYPNAPDGMAIYCDCGFVAKYSEWRKSHDHDASCPTVRPNLAFEGVEIRWYKYPGRGMSTNKSMPPDHWVEWFDRFLAVIRAADKRVG
jgi:hypothetical protein